MNEATLSNLYALAEAMDSDSRVRALFEAEKKLESSPESALLAEKARKAREDYLRNRLELGEEDETTKALLHEFYLAKKALDEEPLAREYSLRFAEVNQAYRALDEILFGPFREKKRCGGHR